MKKYLTVSILLFSLSFLFNPMYASHLASGEICYTAIGGGKYLIRLKLAGACEAGSMGLPNSPSVRIEGCGAAFNQSLDEVSETEFNQICPTGASSCLGGPHTSYRLNTYEKEVDLSGCANAITISYWSCCRNNGIENIQNPAGSSFYVEAYIADPTQNNSSPCFNSPPIIYGCKDEPINYSHGMVEPNGNAVNYQFITPMQSKTSDVDFNGGYSTNSPFQSTGAISLNSLSGLLSYTPSTPSTAVSAFKITEYDASGAIIGYVTRELQVVTSMCNNSAPTSTGIDGTGSFEYTVCEGTSFSFNVYSQDPDHDEITMSASAIPFGSHFSTINNNTPMASGTFSWTPTSAGIYSFTLELHDDVCPYYAFSSYTFTIHVTPNPHTPLVVGVDTSVCPGSPVPLYVNTDPYSSIQWSPSSILSCTNCTNPIATPTSNVNPTVVVTYSDGCAWSESIKIEANAPTIEVFPKTAKICSGSSLPMHVTGDSVSSYPVVWYNGDTLLTHTANPTSSGYYGVSYYHAPTGCVVKDSAYIELSSPPPSAICNNVYVTPGGTGSGDTPTNPTNLYQAIVENQCNHSTLKLSKGTYWLDSSITGIIGSITLEGGYDSTTWEKSSAVGGTRIIRSSNYPEGGPLAPYLAAFDVKNASYFRFQNLYIETKEGGDSSVSTYGVHMSNCSEYEFVRCMIIARDAGDGIDGIDGENGWPGSDGISGGPGSCNGSGCGSGSGDAGGAGGAGGQGGGWVAAGVSGTGRKGGGGGNGGKGGDECVEDNAASGSPGGGSACWGPNNFCLLYTSTLPTT